MPPGQDVDPDIERQRATIEARFRTGSVPAGVDQPRVLTESTHAEARKILSQGGLTYLDPAVIEAVRAGAQPGDPLPALRAGPLIDHVTDTEVVITGDGRGQRVAVLFHHEHFPGIRFGHRFPHPSEELAEYAVIWLQEEIGTGALYRMMRDDPAADSAGIVWTTWGS
ncbi:MAG TPA: hypothetical protein VH641_00290 [Streptosporangiaceae bacterium]|jgi:hypothetical protein